MNIYIVHVINLWPFNVGQDFTLENSLFEAVKLTSNADLNWYKYFGYGIGFDASGSFSLFDGTKIGADNIWCKYEFICAC